jgi:hypothetical protein
MSVGWILLPYAAAPAADGKTAERPLEKGGVLRPSRQTSALNGLHVRAGGDHIHCDSNAREVAVPSNPQVSARRTLMLITTGLWLAATGLVALSLESFGAALVLFGLAGWLLS